MSDGKFIVFEGIDRSGKTTQSKKLVQYLKDAGSESMWMSFPNRSNVTGNAISSFLTGRRNLSDEAQHLLFTANRWEDDANIRYALDRGVNVICDRYYHSGLAYSMARGLNYDWCWAGNSGLLEPDMIFYIDTPVEETSTRSGFGEEKGEEVEFQELVAENYKKLMEIRRDDPWIVLDGTKSVDSLFKDVVTEFNLHHEYRTRALSI